MPARSVLGADGRLPLLVRLPDGSLPLPAGLLEVAPGLGAIHLPPERLAAFLAAHPGARVRLAPPRRPLLDVSHKWTQSKAFKQQTGLDGAGVVIGFIDTGLDVAHADFRDADGKTRVAWLIERGSPLGKQPELELKYGCTDPDQSPCAIFSAADLDNLLESNPDLAPRDPTGHGTHVASIAAGNGGVSVSAKPKFAGVAPAATIIVASPSNEGFSDPDIINAARFIFDQAELLGMPAVLNVSLGSDFGPHDGSSELEKGLASLVGDDEPGRVIVVAAGNSGTLYQIGGQGPYGVHTEVHSSPNATARVPITIPANAAKVQGAGFVWITFRPGDAVAVGLEGPGGEELISLQSPGEDAGYENDNLNVAVINNVVGPVSTITADTNSAVIAWDGSWATTDTFAVLLRGRGDAQLWVTGTGAAAPGLSAGLLFKKALKAGTIAVPASHPDLLAVGCTLNRTSWSPLLHVGFLRIDSFGGELDPLADSTCYFSAAGPTPNGATKPDLLAPGGYVAGAISRDADPRLDPYSMFNQPGCPQPDKPCHMVDQYHALTSGTSMAAPHVAGGAALLLQRDPSLTQGQMMQILQAGAARPTGRVPFDYQQGPGELNLLGALQVLEERAGNEPEPSIEQSYYVLSSPYARPDPSWPVQGTVELRHSDGSIASEVLGNQLKLHIEGGLVVEPLARVRAGLWRFAVSAPRGSGGTSLTVDVRYRGSSLGQRTLPVAVDAWVATAGVRTVGGCGFGRAHSRPSSSLLLLLGLLLLRSRRLRPTRAAWR